MKRRTLTPEELLWQQVWRVWPDAMEYEHIETPFEAPGRPISKTGISRSRNWLAAKQRQARA